MNSMGMLFAWYLMEAILLGAPVLAIGYFVLIRKKWPSVQSKVILSCLVTVFVVAICALTRLRFIDPIYNFICIGFAYLAYCYLVFSCWRFQKIIRFLAIILLSLPIAVGYFIGTIGSLGMMFAVGDYYAKPLSVEKYKAGLICRVVPWGAAFSDEGYTVHLYQQWHTFPFLEREVKEIVIDQSDPEGGPTSASCKEVLKNYSD